jgi:hypothetical protein
MLARRRIQKKRYARRVNARNRRPVRRRLSSSPPSRHQAQSQAGGLACGEVAIVAYPIRISYQQDNSILLL